MIIEKRQWFLGSNDPVDIDMAVLEKDPRGSKVLERCDKYQIQK